MQVCISSIVSESNAFSSVYLIYEIIGMFVVPSAIFRIVTGRSRLTPTSYVLCSDCFYRYGIETVL